MNLSVGATCALVLLFSTLLCGAFGMPVLPGSRLSPHVVENGTHVERNATHTIYHQPTRGVSYYRHTNDLSAQSVSNRDSQGGTYYFLTTGTSYTYFSGEWTVPAKPTTNSGQVLYYWNGLEDAYGTDILQPVLGYIAPNGWYLASWYGDNGKYTNSGWVGVNPGDRIKGVMSLANGNWSVLGYVNGVLTSSLTIRQADFNHGAPQTLAYWLPELWYINSCNQYPISNSITLDNVILQDKGITVQPTWTIPTYQEHDNCNGYGYITSQGGLKLNWQANIAPATSCAVGNEGGSALLSCALHYWFTSIDYATYGVFTSTVCGSETTSCGANVVPQVSNMCLHQSTCSIPANNGAYGDPCPNQPKQLAARGTCQALPQVCGSAGEWTYSTLTCPPGYWFTSIDYAQFGLFLSTTCNYEVQSPSCSVSVGNYVNSICYHQNTCEVPSDWQIYGDPCVGQNKQVVVRATCGLVA